MSDPIPVPAYPPEPRPSENKIFFGRFGFRAGYGILIFLIVATILAIGSGVAALAASGQLHKAMVAHENAKTHPGEKVTDELSFTASYVTVADGVQFLGLLAFCWLMSRAEHRPQRFYGIGRIRLRDTFFGALWGIVSMSALVFFLKAQGLIVFDGRALHGASILYFCAFWLLAFVCVGFYEEYVFRGYLLYTLTRGIWGLAEKISPANPRRSAFWIAATVMSLTFGALHLNNGGENALGIFQVFFIGMVFSYSLWRTGSLWWGIGYHALWDFMQSFTYGVADSGNISVGRLFITHPHGSRLLSGGTDGPEGSLYSVVVVALTLVAIRFTTRPGEYPPPDPLPHTPGSLPPESSTVIA